MLHHDPIVVRTQLGSDDWRAEIDRNLQDLYEMGLWGVPSYRLRGGGQPPFWTWGSDRIWLIESEIRKRVEGQS